METGDRVRLVALRGVAGERLRRCVGHTGVVRQVRTNQLGQTRYCVLFRSDVFATWDASEWFWLSGDEIEAIDETIRRDDDPRCDSDDGVAADRQSRAHAASRGDSGQQTTAERDS